MNANFTPNFNPTKHMDEFRFWCQKVLPLVYDDSLSYYELLCKVTNTLNEIIENASNTNENVANLYTAFVQLQEYVNHYFDSTYVSEQIDSALQKAIEDGALDDTLRELVGGGCILIGDSYGSEIESGVNNWVNTCANLMKVPCYKSAAGGAGFVTSGFFTKFVTLLERANVPMPSTIKQIVVCGGANDIGKSGVEGAIAEFVNRAKELYPNATVYVGFIGVLKGDYNYHETRTTYQEYMCVTKYGGVYLHGVEHININYGKLLDHTHPNEEVSMKLGRGIAEAIKCGYTNVVDYNIVTTHTHSDYSNTSGDIKAWQVGNKVCAFYNSNEHNTPIQFFMNEPASNFANSKDIGTLEQNGIFYPTGYGLHKRIPMIVSVNYEHYCVPGTLTIKNGVISVAFKPSNGISANSTVLAIAFDNIYLEYTNLG